MDQRHKIDYLASWFFFYIKNCLKIMRILWKIGIHRSWLESAHSWRLHSRQDWIRTAICPKIQLNPRTLIVRVLRLLLFNIFDFFYLAKKNLVLLQLYFWNCFDGSHSAGQFWAKCCFASNSSEQLRSCFCFPEFALFISESNICCLRGKFHFLLWSKTLLKLT